jgi:transposase
MILSRTGIAKTGKFNQSQVLLAIMVTTYGLPIGYELYEGSKFEGHTLDDALNQFHKQYKIDKIIFVADAALLITENIARFAERKQPFIVGARIKNLAKNITQKIPDKTAYQTLGMQEDGQEEDITYIDIAMEDRKPSKASQHAKKIYPIMGLKWNDTPYLLKGKK